LGKAGQGIVKPVEESNQHGKHGLGYQNKFKNVEKWDLDNDAVTAYESPIWLENFNDDTPSLGDLKKWKKIGKV
jgi:hypothetical protein